MYQSAYVKTGATVSLSGPDDGWMVEVIGDNLNNKITTGTCLSSPYAEAFLFSNTYTGTNLTGLSGSDEAGCFAERGRSLWVRLTVRPLALLNKN